jgi:hypothetical protein
MNSEMSTLGTHRRRPMSRALVFAVFSSPALQSRNSCTICSDLAYRFYDFLNGDNCNNTKTVLTRIGPTVTSWHRIVNQHLREQRGAWQFKLISRKGLPAFWSAVWKFNNEWSVGNVSLRMLTVVHLFLMRSLLCVMCTSNNFIYTVSSSSAYWYDC